MLESHRILWQTVVFLDNKLTFHYSKCVLQDASISLQAICIHLYKSMCIYYTYTYISSRRNNKMRSWKLIISSDTLWSSVSWQLLMQTLVCLHFTVYKRIILKENQTIFVTRNEEGFQRSTTSLTETKLIT